MKFFKRVKDGGPNSPVEAFFLCEIKGLFSIAILKFNQGGREALHSHAFNALTWFISGDMTEYNEDGSTYKYVRKLMPKVTPRSQIHKVFAKTTGWVFTIRGPWQPNWIEIEDHNGTRTTTRFGHGRVVKAVKAQTVISGSC